MARDRERISSDRPSETRYNCSSLRNIDFDIVNFYIDKKLYVTRAKQFEGLRNSRCTQKT
ncbi:hypothetical protein CKA32_003690 [Geitlerinema sp. FC II]|nr:hypothetical protein CKA32_003690 [Geitlerinema sp. FC II]